MKMGTALSFEEIRKSEKASERKNERRSYSAKYPETNIESTKRHQRIDHIGTDYMKRCINERVRIKLSYRSIEDENMSGISKNLRIE